MDSALLVALLTSILFSLASGDPQTNLVDKGCSQYNATPASTFITTVNSALADINTSISLSDFSNFATTMKRQSSTVVYALFMCRSYLSLADCKTCFSTAVKRIHSCGVGNGARVVYDGCFLRYESSSFFDVGTGQGDTQVCNGSTNGVAGSTAQVSTMLTDLATAVPKISGYAAAVEMSGVYGYADCVKTLTRSTCEQCLEVCIYTVLHPVRAVLVLLRI
jgi:Salt stress response/antifungal